MIFGIRRGILMGIMGLRVVMVRVVMGVRVIMGIMGDGEGGPRFVYLLSWRGEGWGLRGAGLGFWVVDIWLYTYLYRCLSILSKYSESAYMKL